jgi:hypothetical protein
MKNQLDSSLLKREIYIHSGYRCAILVQIRVLYDYQFPRIWIDGISLVGDTVQNKLRHNIIMIDVKFNNLLLGKETKIIQLITFNYINFLQFLILLLYFVFFGWMPIFLERKYWLIEKSFLIGLKVYRVLADKY